MKGELFVLAAITLRPAQGGIEYLNSHCIFVFQLSIEFVVYCYHRSKSSEIKDLHT